MQSISPSRARTVTVFPNRPIRGVSPVATPIALPQKAPAEVLDYTAKLWPWLEGTGDSLAFGSEIFRVSPSGAATDMAVISHQVVGNEIQFFVSGGTAGALYTVTLQIASVVGRVGVFVFSLAVNSNTDSAAPSSAVAAAIASLQAAIAALEATTGQAASATLTVGGNTVTVAGQPLSA